MNVQPAPPPVLPSVLPPIPPSGLPTVATSGPPAAREADGPFEAPGAPARTTSPAASTAGRSADPLLAGLGRRFGGPALRVDFTLRMPSVRQIFRRDFVYVSRQLHALESSRRVQGLDRELLAQALRVVALQGEAAQVHLLQQAAETAALIARHGEAATAVAFAPPRALQATIVSPLARVFLDILCLADDATAQIERAWLLGLVDERDKVAQWVACRNAAVAFKRSVRQQRHAVGQHVREVNLARRAQRPAEDRE